MSAPVSGLQVQPLLHETETKLIERRVDQIHILSRSRTFVCSVFRVGLAAMKTKQLQSRIGLSGTSESVGLLYHPNVTALNRSAG